MSDHTAESFAEREYEYGFVTDIEQESLPPGLNEETVRFISAKKNEPEWLLQWRLKALQRFLEMAVENEGIIDLPGVEVWRPPHMQSAAASCQIMKFWFKNRKIQNDPLNLPSGAVG